MKRTVLNPTQSVWLARTIDRNRRTFGGARMMADDTGTEGDKGGDKTGEKSDQAKDEKPEKKGDDALGEGGKKAIEAEREARKNAEDQMKSLKSEFDGFKSALVEALGIKPKDGEKGTDALTAVQEQLAAMQHESATLRLANTHKITDKDDLELLATAKNADAMEKLAERLAPTTQDEGDAKSRRPKPDNSQGNGRKDGKTSGSVAQVMADRRAAREAKNPSNSTS